MTEVFLLINYNLTTPKIYFKQGPKILIFFCQIGLKYRKIVFKYWKYILNTLKSVSKYIRFGKTFACIEPVKRQRRVQQKGDVSPMGSELLCSLSS